MIRHPDPRTQAEIEVALRSENPGAFTRYEFWAGGRELSERVVSLSYGREGDSIARALDAEIAGPLSPSMRSQPTTVDVIVAGHATRRFTGRAHKPSNAGFRSRLLANTAGWWASGDSAVKLGRERRFAGYSPKRAAEELLLRLPYSGAIDVQQTTQETFLRGALEAFPRTDETKVVLDAIAEETGLVFRDTRLDGCLGEAPRPAPLSGEVVWTFRVGRDVDEDGGFEHEGDVAEFRDVLAWRDPGDGTVEVLAHANIPGSSAPEDATFLIPVETEGPAAYAEARAKVNEAATNLVHGKHPVTLNLDWVHALLEEGDVVEVLEPTEDEEDLILRRWLIRVDLIGPEDPEALTQQLSGFGTYTEARVAKATTVAPSASPGVVRPPYGYDWLGRPFFSVALPWVSLEGGKLVLDRELAREADGVEIFRDPDTGKVLVSR